MHAFGRFFYGIWRGLDVLRRCLHLVLLLALLGIVIGALRQSTPRLPDKAALVVRPSGDIVEQLSGEPIERAINEAQGEGTPQTLLWDLTTAIRAAATDSRIAVLVIDTDDMGSAGQAKLEELAAAIAAFRHSGKKIISHGSYFLQNQYYLAAQADEVYLDPFGFVLLDGYDRYRMFFKDALDKLSIDMHLFRAGKFKSAAETFTRRDMSPEDREESDAYLQALWRGYRTAVSSARNLKPEALAQYANGYVSAVAAAGGDTAKVAKDNGLVSALKTPQEVEDLLIDLAGADSAGKSYRQVSVADYLRATHAEDKQRGKGQAVGVVIASGEILDAVQRSKVYEYLSDLIGIEHGETPSWIKNGEIIFQAKAKILADAIPGGEALAVFGPNGSVTAGFYNAALTTFNNVNKTGRIFFEGGYNNPYYLWKAKLQTSLGNFANGL